jgi:hypothetical protein
MVARARERVKPPASRGRKTPVLGCPVAEKRIAQWTDIGSYGMWLIAAVGTSILAERHLKHR